MRDLLRLTGVAACGVLLVAGCGKDNSRPQPPGGTANAATSSRAEAGLPPTNVVKTLAQMASNDVVVSVNGAELTKQQFEDGMNQVIQQLSQLPANQRGQQMAMLQGASRSFIPRFIGTQLLVQDARRLGVMSADEVKAKAGELIAEAAKKAGKELAAFQKGFPGGAEVLWKEAEQSVLVSALIATNIPPKIKVDDAFIAAALASIKEENDAIAATNGLKVARLNELRKEILGGADFGSLADKHSQCTLSGPGKNGYWGEFERGALPNLKMRTALFALKPGEISEVLEDEEGFHLVKLLERMPEKKNEKGRVIEPESLKLAHILLNRDPALELAAADQLKKDLTAQMREQAIEEYVQNLKLTAQIVYPNGTNFWSRAASQPAAKPQTQASGN